VRTRFLLESVEEEEERILAQVCAMEERRSGAVLVRLRRRGKRGRTHVSCSAPAVGDTWVL